VPKTITVKTAGPQLYAVTRDAQRYLSEIGATNGLLTLFVQHTSCSLVIQENADPDVCDDLVDHFRTLAPEDAPYRHVAEGPDDMPAHIKTALTDISVSVPVADGALSLGTWQGIYLFEHRDRPHVRNVVMTFVREG
jgi:secondary thiamine-phosphate synthase enzyme